MDLSSVITLIIIIIVSTCTIAFAHIGDGVSVVTFGLIMICICILIKHSVDLQLIGIFLSDYDEMYTYDAVQELYVLNQQKELLNKKTAAALKNLSSLNT